MKNSNHVWYNIFMYIMLFISISLLIYSIFALKSSPVVTEHYKNVKEYSTPEESIQNYFNFCSKSKNDSTYVVYIDSVKTILSVVFFDSLLFAHNFDLEKDLIKIQEEDSTEENLLIRKQALELVNYSDILP